MMCMFYVLCVCVFQGLHLVLSEMSNPLDMDPRRQLVLQCKGT